MTVYIPKFTTPLVGTNGLAERTWYQYWEATGTIAVDLSALTAQVAELQVQVDNIPDSNSFTITGGQSVSVAGSPSAGNVSLSLVGDQASPGALKYYGTDASGTKGYYNATIFPQVMSIASLRP